MALRDLLLKRIGQAIVTIFIVLVIDFAIFNLLPGSFIDLLAQNPNISQAALDIMEKEFGLNKPLPEQFLIFLSNFLQGRLGFSLWYNVPVAEIIFDRLINSLILLIPADIIAIIIGIWIGKQSAWRRGSITDLFGWSLALITYSIPAFWLAMTFLSVFGYNLDLFPTNPYNFVGSLKNIGPNPFIFFIDTLHHLALPFIVIVISLTGIFAVIMRNSLLETLSEDYMLTAKAKGRSEKEQLNKEAVPNALIPVATVVTIQIGFSVVGALLVEIVFNYHGIGRLLWDAVGHRDFPLLQASFFMFTAVLIITNLVADFVYFYLDPRIRVSGPDIRQAREINIDNKNMAYLIYISAFIIIILTFMIFESDPSIAFSIFMGLIFTVSFFRDFLYKKYEIQLLNPLVLIILSLVLLSLGLIEKDPTLVFLFYLASILVVFIIKQDIILHIIQNFLKNYKLSNLLNQLNHNRPYFLRLAFLIIFLIGLLLFTILQISYLLSLNILDSDTELYIFLIIFIGMVGIITTIVLGRWQGVKSAINQVLETKKGIFGIVLVFFFLFIAIFGDIIAPFNPEKIASGPLFLRPTPVLEYQFISFNISILLIILSFLVNLIADKKSRLDIPSGAKIFSTGFILLVFSLFLLKLSLDKQNDFTLILSSVMVMISILISMLGLIRLYQYSLMSINDFFTIRLLSQVILVSGFLLLIFTGYSIITDHPQGFGAFHLLGTNQLGQDVFSQIIIGVRITLLVAILATTISVIIGSSIGLISGYYGGLTDSLLMRLTDLFFVIPAFVLMIIVAAVVGPSLETMLLVIGIFSWATTARIVRAQTLSIKERSYVDRVRSIGGSDLYIMIKHILPAIIPIIIAQTILLIINSIFFEISLDFVGLGDPNLVSWGSMLFLANQLGAITLDLYWLIYPPGFAVIILLLGFAFLGFSFDEVTNPKLRRR